ncbi:hypothetical protein [Streptomyces boluensis]|uniref:Uncharacterized protein n=1 Tax=Streptomyces boluensis TaxID=1775135 RepID=A0A964UTN5_9ACTN|nr:hypothetical protein [Streptomyces boluensis]NBE53968.1 hypothetical protein [Streptomyces boluensis]
MAAPPSAAPAPKPGPKLADWSIDYASASRDAELVAIAATSADEAWAVGSEAVDEDDIRYFLLHLDGGTWQRRPLPPQLSADAQLNAPSLEASGSGNVWLSGDLGMDGDYKPFTLRWDGARWRTIPVGSRLLDVAPLAPDEVWALDNDGKTARRWDGNRWTTMRLPATAASLDALAPDDIWAVGDRKEADGTRQPAAMRWDGHTWRLTKTPEYRFHSEPYPYEAASLADVIVVSPTEVWALGLHDYEAGDSDTEEEEVYLRWDGTRWAKARTGFDYLPSGTEFAADGAGGFLLSPWRHRSADGTLRKIGRPPLIAGRSKTVTEADRSQHLWVADMARVPGTRQVLGAGSVELGSHGNANFRRAVVVRYDPTSRDR